MYWLCCIRIRFSTMLRRCSYTDQSLFALCTCNDLYLLWSLVRFSTRIICALNRHLWVVGISEHMLGGIKKTSVSKVLVKLLEMWQECFTFTHNASKRSVNNSQMEQKNVFPIVQTLQNI